MRLKGLKRREFLRLAGYAGLGASFWPVLSSMQQLARAQAVNPKRLINFFVSSGAAKQFFWPTEPAGANFSLSTSLAPLEPYKSRLTILQGLGIGWGSDHRFGIDNCLNASDPTSYEHVVAEGRGIELLNLSVAPLWGGDEMSTIDRQKQPGISDPAQAREEVLRGLAAQPAAGAPAPTPGAGIDAIRQFRAAAMDLSQAELDVLASKVSSLPIEADKVRLHIEALQAVKAELETAPEHLGSLDCTTLQTTALDASAGLEHNGEACAPNLPALLDAQIENVAEAFKCAGRQIANIQVMHAWGNHAFTWIGLSEAHHQQLSHWIPSDPGGTTAQKFAQCHNWLSTKFLSLLQQLDVPDPLDPGKTVLDNTAVLWLSEVNGSDAHLADNLPLVIAGDMGGALTTGMYHQFTNRNVGDLYATLATAMGVPLTSYGPHDSQGLVTELLA
jgi:hypothetical protein